MKINHFLLASSWILILLLPACKSNGPGNPQTPEGTLRALISAIEDEDFARYRALWHPERVKTEGMIEKLQTDPSEWKDLQARVRGKYTIETQQIRDQARPPRCRMRVVSPEAKGGGIGSLRMVQVDGRWLMWSW
ncbi:MAG: hypothetical protein AAGN35_13030 [Bacteroidota bacterium]